MHRSQREDGERAARAWARSHRSVGPHQALASLRTRPALRSCPGSVTLGLGCGHHSWPVPRSPSLSRFLPSECSPVSPSLCCEFPDGQGPPLGGVAQSLGQRSCSVHVAKWSVVPWAVRLALTFLRQNRVRRTGAVQVGREAAPRHSMDSWARKQGTGFHSVPSWLSQLGPCFHLYKPQLPACKLSR